MLIPTSKLFGVNLKSQISNLILPLWYALSNLKMTGILIGIIMLVFLLSLIIPQQTAPGLAAATPEVWIASLPPALRNGGEALFFLGFAHISQSVWLWLPLALLLLNSMIALAHYFPGSWQRMKPAMPSLAWQHPLAQRGEHVTRLPEAPDEYLASLKRTLQQRGFFLYQDSQTDERIIGAAQRRWTWLAPVGWYGGLILLIIAFLLSYFFAQGDNFTLLPQEAKSSPLFAGTFELEEVNTPPGFSRIKYTASATDGEQVSSLLWRLYQPTWLNQTLIVPITMEPVLTIEAKDGQGRLARLIPFQENLAPAERLYLPFTDAQSPLYFLIPSAKLAFQILPSTDLPESFNIKVRPSVETSAVTEVKAKLGQAFTINDMAVTIGRSYNLTILTRRDPAWPFYVIGLVLIGVATIFYFWRPPLQLWLIPEVKGRGGQLYGVVEQLGSVKEIVPFLDELWTVNSNLM